MPNAPEPITIHAGTTELAGTLYRPETLRGAVMIAPATGIRQRFYTRFATFLQERGYGVLTFENQGIGGSLAGSVAQCDATLVSWGQSDMSAALDHLMRVFPDTRYHLIGHSAGGQLVGLMTNATALDSLIGVAASSGSLRNMRGRFRIRANIFMRLLLPVTSAVMGAGRSDWAGMGEPLPRGVAQQWSEWCRGQGYVEVELRKGPLPHTYDQLDMPALWLYATDDDIANTTNVHDMLRVYSRLKPELRELEPSQYGLSSIGHMGLFRHEVLWPQVAEWLDEVSGRA